MKQNKVMYNVLKHYIIIKQAKGLRVYKISHALNIMRTKAARNVRMVLANVFLIVLNRFKKIYRKTYDIRMFAVTLANINKALALKKEMDINKKLLCRLSE